MVMYMPIINLPPEGADGVMHDIQRSSCLPKGDMVMNMPIIHLLPEGAECDDGV
jgi:hypothetical protein